MKLPILSHPTFEVIIPSSKGKLKHTYRPLLVKEEKILLMAKKDSTNSSIYKAIEQVLSYCFVTEQLGVLPLKEIQKYTLFDLEYVFLQVRAESVSNVSKVVYKDSEDDKEYTLDIPLKEVNIKWPEKVDDEQFFTVLLESKGPNLKTSGFIMKYPSAQIYTAKVFSNVEATAEDLLHELIVWAIDSFFEGENSYSFAGLPRAEVEKFMAELDLASYEKLKAWVAELPRLYYELSYENSKGTSRKIELSTLSDFFTL
jgi:hypothetical protein